METMAFMSDLETTRNFVKLAADTFQWGDLSEDVVMDIGCGKELHCTKIILDYFPKVKSVIALDRSPTKIKGISHLSPQIKAFLADVLSRNDIRQYKGKIDKVISSDVFHSIFEKENAFKNVYQLLKPGGQAAFLFTSDIGLYHVINELKLDSKYKDYYKDEDFMDLYSSEFKDHQYREMLTKIGFKVVEIVEKKHYFPNENFELVEEYLYSVMKEAFSVPPDLVLEMINAASSIYRRKFCDQKSVYVETEMSIFVTKPAGWSTRCTLI